MDIKTKQIILLVGIPGSGKTTLAKTLTGKGFQRISADTIRQELYGDEAEQGDPKEVFAIFYKHLEELLAGGTPLVVDNTNLKFRHRKEIIDRAKQAGYDDIQLWVLDVSLEVCLARNKERNRMVQEDVVSNMFATFNRTGHPKSQEGRIVIFSPDKK